MPEPLELSTKYYFWKPYAAYFNAFQLKAYRDFVHFPDDGLILDLGCNDGTFAQMLKELFQFKMPLIGVDYDGKNVVQAAQKTSLYSQVLQLDASHLTFENESFDAVFANQILHCIRPSSDQAIREISRILKKEGTFVCTVVTNLAQQHFWISEFLNKIGLTGLGHLYRQTLSTRMEMVSPFSPEEWCSLLSENGLIVQNVIPFISEAISHRWSILTLTPFRAMGILKFIPVKQLHRLTSTSMSRLMMRSYNQLAITIPPESVDYVLIISKKL